MLLVEMGMTFAGSFGVPRRHWDISFSQSLFDVQFDPTVDIFLAVMGIGGILAVTGALGFVAIAVKSVFFGDRLMDIPRGTELVGVPRGLTHPPVHAADADARNEQLHDPARGIMGATPGTLVLVFVFLVAFMVYYFTNWKLLSFLWKIG
jgi:cytochrome c oxidase subunit 1